jgi:hypothetical protein
MQTIRPTKPCPALDRFDTIMTIASVAGELSALYLTLRVYAATKSMWKSFGTFIGLSLVIGCIGLLYTAKTVRDNPCVQESLIQM